jgi:hypothetical protein
MSIYGSAELQCNTLMVRADVLGCQLVDGLTMANVLGSKRVRKSALNIFAARVDAGVSRTIPQPPSEL